MRILFFIFCITAAGAAFAQVDLQKGLRLYYPFSGSVADSSGNNNNPVKNKTELTEDRFGKPASACHFNGKNAYIDIPDAPSLHMEEKISLCVWVRPTGFYKGKCHVNSILIKGKQTSESGFFLRYDDNMYRHDGNCYAKLDEEHENFSGNGAGYPSYEPYVQLMKWQSLIFIFDGKFAKLYINSVLAKTDESVLNLYFTNKVDLIIGKENDDFPYWLNADLDDLRIYDRAITDDEIKVISDSSHMIKAE